MASDRDIPNFSCSRARSVLHAIPLASSPVRHFPREEQPGASAANTSQAANQAKRRCDA
jgi:hypothetical protein